MGADPRRGGGGGGTRGLVHLVAECPPPMLPIQLPCLSWSSLSEGAGPVLLPSNIGADLRVLMGGATHLASTSGPFAPSVRASAGFVWPARAACSLRSFRSFSAPVRVCLELSVFCCCLSGAFRADPLSFPGPSAAVAEGPREGAPSLSWLGRLNPPAAAAPPRLLCALNIRRWVRCWSSSSLSCFVFPEGSRNSLGAIEGTRLGFLVEGVAG